MDTRIVIFIGFSALALIINTAMIFAAYKMLSAMSTKLTASVEKFRSNLPLEVWIPRLQAASETAVHATQTAKQQIVSFEPSIQRIQATYAQSLEKTDVRLGSALRAVHTTANVASRLVAWPFREVNSTAAGILKFVSSIRGSKNGGNARSRRTR
jgi:hypothetical protein